MSLGDRICFCCHRRESKIDHPRVGREGPEIARAMRRLMTWVEVPSAQRC